MDKLTIKSLTMCRKENLFSYIATASNGNTYSSPVYGGGGGCIEGPTIKNVGKTIKHFISSIENQNHNI